MTRPGGDTNLISTADAAASSGYSKDYIGQLCREGKIRCERVSGQWQVHADTLRSYQEGERSENENEDPETIDIEELVLHRSKTGNVRSDTFTYDGIEYISTGRAAELTGYAQDYIGQLARTEEVHARRIGRRWFVSRKELVEHKKHNDALLQEVQARSSGVHTEEKKREDLSLERATDVASQESDIHFNVRYIPETLDTHVAPPAPSVHATDDSTSKTLKRSASDMLKSVPIRTNTNTVPQTPQPNVSMSIDGISKRNSTKIPSKRLKNASRISEMRVETTEDVFEVNSEAPVHAQGTSRHVVWISITSVLVILSGGVFLLASEYREFVLGSVPEELRTHGERLGTSLPGNTFFYHQLDR